jgi:hypothetical protein
MNDDIDDDRNDRDHGRRGRRYGRVECDNQKKGDRVATGERKKRREGDDRQATTSKKPWARRNECWREERVGCDDRERRPRNEAHAINHRWMSNDDKSRDDDKKTVVSEDDNKDDYFVVAMAPPAKKATTNHRVVPKKARKVVEPTTKMQPFFAESKKLLDGKSGNPLAI